jgi:hypothetical protein
MEVVHPLLDRDEVEMFPAVFVAAVPVFLIGVIQSSVGRAMHGREAGFFPESESPGEGEATGGEHELAPARQRRQFVVARTAGLLAALLAPAAVLAGVFPLDARVWYLSGSLAAALSAGALLWWSVLYFRDESRARLSGLGAIAVFAAYPAAQPGLDALRASLADPGIMGIAGAIGGVIVGILVARTITIPRSKSYRQLVIGMSIISIVANGYWLALQGCVRLPRGPAIGLDFGPYDAGSAGWGSAFPNMAKLAGFRPQAFVFQLVTAAFAGLLYCLALAYSHREKTAVSGTR